MSTVGNTALPAEGERMRPAEPSIQASPAGPPLSAATPNRSKRGWLRVPAGIAQKSQAYLAGLTKTRVFTIALLGVSVVGYLDPLTPPLASLSVFYLLPVMLASWFVGRTAGTIVSLLGGVLWFLAEYSAGSGIPFAEATWNASSSVCVFLIVVFLLAHLRVMHRDLEENLRLRSAELEAEVARRLAMEREIGVVSHREQQRIAYELHDGLGQELGALAFHAKLLASRLTASGPEVAAEAERLVGSLNQSIGRTRALSRLLDPLGSESGGLRHSLTQLVDYSGQVYGVACTLEAPEELPRFSPEAELHIYRIAQESIRNAVEHGRATTVSVSIALLETQLCLSVLDNGTGFVPGVAPKDSVRGMGLRIMEYRANAVGGYVLVTSRPGRGCQVDCTMPLAGNRAVSPAEGESM